MSKAGDVMENPVTGERGVARIGTEQTGGELLVADLYIRPGGAVMGEHLHPAVEERFTVLRGRVGFRLAGRESIAEPGVRLIAPAEVPHDWWNAGPEEALVCVEIRPAARFEAFLKNAFGLAQDDKVNRRGMPNLLQLAVFAREFDDVIQFTHPPRVVQRLLFGLLAPLAWLLGYRGSYPEYLARGPSGSVPVEPMDVAAALAGFRTASVAELGAAQDRGDM
jgi:quercetin dioxygenase-like cupin family protein